MKFSRCSRGIAALAVILALFALFFDVIPAAVASGALVVFLAVRAAVFLSALSTAAGSLIIRRSLSSLFTRQGTPVAVKTEGVISIPPGFSATLSDLPPHGAGTSSGITIVTVSTGENSFCMDYTLVPLTTGEHGFEGLRLSLSDAFFSSDLVCHTPNAAAPPLVVLPSAEYSLAGQDTYGEKESARPAVLRSPDIRSFREYLPGDDPRSIDWKLSAKYDTLYVREYMGRAEQASLLIFDVPDITLTFDGEAFNRLKEAAVSAIVNRISDNVPFSVLIVSGPNLISFTPLDRDPRRLVAMMNQLVPAHRLHHMFRYHSTLSLKRRFSPLTGSTEPFSQNLCKISATFLSHRSPVAFESQVSRVFNGLPGSTAHLFTLAARDSSHIRIISEQASLNAIRLRVHIPTNAHDPARLSQTLAAQVEVV